MVAVRELATRLVLENLGVISQIKSFKKDVTDLSGTNAVVGVKADVAAAKKQLDDTRNTLKSVTQEAAQAKAGVLQFSKSLSDGSKEGSGLDNVMNKVRATAAGVKGALVSAGDAGKSAASHLKANWSDVEGTIQRVAAVAGAVAVGSVYTAANTKANLGTIETARGKDYRNQMEGWVQGAGEQTNNVVSASNRSASALALAKQFKGLDATQGKEFLELMEKEMVRETGNTDNLPQILNMIGTGNISDEMMKTLPGMGIDMDALKARAKAYYENPAYMRGHSEYKTEKDVLAGLFVEDFTKFAKTEKLPSGKTLAESKFGEDFDLEPLDKMQVLMSNIANTLGTELQPYLIMLVSVLASVNELLQSTPGAAKFVALAVGIGAVASSAILAAAGITTAANALGVGAVASKVFAGGIGAARAAMALMAAHPLIAVLMILIGLLVLVEAKTGIFSKGFTALVQAAGPAYAALASILGLDWGKIGGNVLSGLIGALGKLTGLASGGLKGLAGGISAKLGIDTGDLKSGLKVGLMAAFPVLGLAALATHIPSMGKSLLESLSKSDVMSSLTSKIIMWIMMVYDLLKPWIDIFTGLYNTLASFWEWVVTLPEEIRKILPEALGGGEKLEGQALYDRLVKDLPQYLKGQGYGNVSAEAAEWLAKALTGQDVNPDDKQRLGITDPMLKEAGEYKDKLSGGSSSSPPPAKTPEGTPAAVAPVLSQDIADVQKDLDEGKPVSGLSTDMGNPSGLVKIGYNWLAGKLSGHSEGGKVLKSGAGIIHEGERIETADVVREESTLEKLINVAKSGSVLSGTGVSLRGNGLNGPVVNFNAPLLQISDAKIASDFDIDDLVDKLMWKMRGRFEDLMQRTAGLYEG